jgi:DNA-binding XRE family transcriptional regulator
MKIANDNHDRVDMEDAALTMAVAVLVERIRGLPKEDKEDLYKLSNALFLAENEEETRCAAKAFREILDQKDARVVPFVTSESPTSMDGWITFISGRIKKAREDAGLTQEALEGVTGLPQSHISRLENGVHSPSSATLEKIAKATNQPVTFFDPSHQE